MHPSNYDGPGIYRHYKGGIYLVDGLVTLEATGEPAVLYEPITPEGREAAARDFTTMCIRYVRPLDDFNDEVNGVPRFEKTSV